MVMKTVTMASLKAKGEVPKSPDKIHQDNIGKGNYNRWNALRDHPRQRLLSEGKRPLPNDGLEDTPSKAPRLDEAVLEQLSKSEDNIRNIKKVMEESRKAGENTYTATDGGMGTAFHKLWEAVNGLVLNQENITSMVSDQVKYTDKVSKEQKKVSSQVTEVKNQVLDYAGAANRGNVQSTKPTKSPPSEEDRNKKRVRQAINKAEKATLLFGLDLGDVPTMNKETLARKVTINLHKRGKIGGKDAGYTEKQVESMTDDMLSCAGLDFLGNSTKKYENRYDDENSGKFCSLPVKMIFKGKKDRIQAEQHLRKLCKIKVSTPYPKKLRIMMADLVKEAKAKRNGCFILTKVSTDNLTISAHASVDGKWEDLNLYKDIPLNILDRYETQEADADMEMEGENHDSAL